MHVATSTGTQRIVTVLFADVVGSTAIGERLGPERSKFLFDEIMALIAGEIRRFDGTVAQLAGDGLFALFGAPVAHEDDAERAVRAALAIQTAIATYGEELLAATASISRVRVASTPGPVVLTDGDDSADRYNALGDTANVAARLQQLAPDGGIVVGPETERQVQYCVELESLGEVELRGLERPLRAARVTGARGPAQVRAVVPVVGRSAELAVLDEACQAIADGSGAIISITGESGIGKSRLVVEARRRFGDRIRFLEGRAGSYAESFPYWPVRDLLRDWLSVGVDAPEARMRLELKAALGGLGEGSETAYPFLARLLGLPLEAEASAALREMSRESVQQQTFAAVGLVVRRLAEAHPLCIIVDDLQWADSLTLELVEDLLGAHRRGAARAPAALPRRSRPAVVAARRARPRGVPAPLPRDRAPAAAGGGELRARRGARRGDAARLAHDAARGARRRQPVLPRGGAAGSDRARGAAPARGRLGARRRPGRRADARAGRAPGPPRPAAARARARSSPSRARSAAASGCRSSSACCRTSRSSPRSRS